MIFNLPDFNPNSDTPTRQDFVLGHRHNLVDVIFGGGSNVVNLSGYIAQLLYRKKMATTWTVAQGSVVEPQTPNPQSSRITVDFGLTELDGSSLENFREYVLELRNPTGEWRVALEGRISLRTSRRTTMSLISMPLLSGASTLDSAVGVDLLNKGPENAIYINWGTGVTAGAVVIETASTLGYTGTWANFHTVSFSGTAPKVDCVQITGAFRALRTRISQAVVGGTVSTEISTSE